MACTSNCNSYSSGDKTEIQNNYIFCYYTEMEAESTMTSFWRQGKVSFSPVLNLIPLLKVGDLQKQTELTLPVNTRSSEIKVTFPKFVCLYSRLNIQQYNIHTSWHPKTCISRWAITILKPINLIQIYSQHTTLFARWSEKYFCIVARLSVFKGPIYVKILLVILLLLFQWTMAVPMCIKPQPFFQQDKPTSLKLCQKSGANSSYHASQLMATTLGSVSCTSPAQATPRNMSIPFSTYICNPSICWALKQHCGSQQHAPLR